MSIIKQIKDLLKYKSTYFFYYISTFTYFLTSKLFSVYKFSYSDFYLHIQERFWVTPKLEINDFDNKFLLIKIENRSFFWPIEQRTSGLEWLYNEVYCPFENNPTSYSHPLTPVPVGGWVIDAGACEGFFTMHAVEQGAKRILAIEPVPVNLEALKKSMALDQIKNNYSVDISFHQLAIADKIGNTEFSINPNEPWNSNFQNNETNVKKIQVPLSTIDSLAEIFGLNGKGLIKMDIEGAEMSALRGAAMTLREHKPKLAIAVYHEYKNAIECRDIILKANPTYKITFRGMNLWEKPPRPYLLFAY